MANEKEERNVIYKVGENEVKLSINFVRNNLVHTKNPENVTDAEIINFMMLAKHNKLDPFLKEVYLVKFKEQAQIIVSKEAFLKRANANENYDGFEAGIIVERNGEMVDLEGSVQLSNDRIIGGWAKVYRKDRSHQTVSRISISEFTTGKSTWQSMPAVMIRKTAIVNALREAFPQDLGAMYTEEEQREPVDVGSNKPTDNKTQNALDKISEIADSTVKEEQRAEKGATVLEGEFVEPRVTHATEEEKNENRRVFEEKIAAKEENYHQENLMPQFDSLSEGNGEF